MTEDEKYLRNHILISIKSGLQSREDIISEALEIIEDEALESVVSEEWVRETTTLEYNKNLNNSNSWKTPTDTDRLHNVFDQLCQKKIVALHNAGYTTSEAIYDIENVWAELEDEDIHPIGYCYYHGQDLERVIETEILSVGFYGKKVNNEKDAIGIGTIVSTALKDAGFEIKWDGTASSRINIQNFKWQNIFTSDEEVEEKWGYDRTITLMKG